MIDAQDLDDQQKADLGYDDLKKRADDHKKSVETMRKRLRKESLQNLSAAILESSKHVEEGASLVQECDEFLVAASEERNHTLCNKRKTAVTTRRKEVRCNLETCKGYDALAATAYVYLGPVLRGENSGTVTKFAKDGLQVSPKTSWNFPCVWGLKLAGDMLHTTLSTLEQGVQKAIQDVLQAAQNSERGGAVLRFAWGAAGSAAMGGW